MKWRWREKMQTEKRGDTLENHPKPEHVTFFGNSTSLCVNVVVMQTLPRQCGTWKPSPTLLKQQLPCGCVAFIDLLVDHSGFSSLSPRSFDLSLAATLHTRSDCSSCVPPCADIGVYLQRSFLHCNSCMSWQGSFVVWHPWQAVVLCLRKPVTVRLLQLWQLWKMA